MFYLYSVTTGKVSFFFFNREANIITQFQKNTKDNVNGILKKRSIYPITQERNDTGF